MASEPRVVTVAPNGRLSIPADQRRALGLENGGAVVITVVDGELCIRPVRKLLNDLRARVAAQLRDSGDTVAQFLADRRADSEPETTATHPSL